jgi:hypothetical protein
MANVDFNTTYNPAGAIMGGFEQEGIRGGFQPGTHTVANVRSTGVVPGNNPAVPVFVPYGQTWPR